MKFPTLLVTLWMTTASLFAAQALPLSSPNGSLTLSVSLRNDRVGYTLQRDSTPLLQWAPLGIVLNGADSGVGVPSLELLGNSDIQTKTFPVSGVHAEGKVSFIEYRVGGLKNGQTLRFRIFDDGVAFRYEFPDGTAGTVNSESTGFGIPGHATLWTQDALQALGSHEGIFSASRLADFKQPPPEQLQGKFADRDPKNPFRAFVRSSPLVAVLPGGHFLLFQEGESFGLGWAGMKYALNDGTATRVFYYNNRDGFPFPKDGTRTPWRVILATRDLNTLVNSDLVASLAPRPDAALFPAGHATDWIKPGKATWSWWSTGGTHLKDQFAYIDFAHELGFEYLLIDDGWAGWKRDDGADAWTLLGELAAYGARKQVRLWVWKAWHQLSDPKDDWAQMRDFFAKVKSLGAAGLKIDFLNSQTPERIRFYDTALRIAAEHQLMLNFHGANTPSGEAHTWPNEMSREGLYGLVYNRRTDIPLEQFCALPFTRFVTGHGDFTPGYFGRDPKKLDGTSWTQQLAYFVVYNSPLQCLASSPADIHEALPEKSLQRAVLRTVPTTWDETIVLPGADIGRLAPFARRKGNTWFVGILNGPAERKGELRLGFLEHGRNYRAILITDDPDQPDSWHATESVLSSIDSVPLFLRSGGGAVLRLEPIKAN